MNLPTIRLSKKGNLTVPPEFAEQKDLIVTMPWMKERRRRSKDGWFVNTMTWCRIKSMGEKPYLPEGHVEFKIPGRLPQRYKVVEA